jgi:hypothetical protein
MKAFLTYIFIFCIFNTNVFSQNDFRGLYWGISISEAKKIETSPLTKEEKNITAYANLQEYYDGINLIYDNVSIFSKPARLTYLFKNGKLVKITVTFKDDRYTYKGNVSQIISRFGDLLGYLGEKKFFYTLPLQCGEHVYSGPDYRNPDNEKIRKMSDKNIDNLKLQLVDKMIAEKKYQSAFFRFENERSRGSMMFLSQYSKWKETTPVILEFTPSSSIEKELSKGF